ncbi:MAG: DUF4180 domain-containing protein [Saprospiraceae bacterium]
MKITTHQVNNLNIAEVTAPVIFIRTVQDGLDLMGNMYYQGFDRLVLHAENITPEFFDLKTKIAGEILQKFSNYRVRLSIVGDFTVYTSRSLKDFIHESNKGKLVNFVDSLEEALERLSS